MRILPFLPKALLAAAFIAPPIIADGRHDYRSFGQGSAPYVAPGYDSPAVFPTPNTTGGSLIEALRRAEAAYDDLTEEERLLFVQGTPGPCAGNIPPIPSIGFRGLCMQDSPLTLRNADFVSVFPAGISTAASFNKELAFYRASGLGYQFKAKGVNVFIGPPAGAMGRVPQCGRAWEGFSIDPYLNGILMEETVKGIQRQGVQSQPKHFLLNEQESQRKQSYVNGSIQWSNTDNHTVYAVSENADDRTIHEVYMWPFANAIRAGALSICTGYNRVNGTYAAQNSKLLNGLLKEELGFPGYTVSDWGAVHNGLDAIQAGLDIEMPGDVFLPEYPFPNFINGSIREWLADGTVPQSRIHDTVTRTLLAYYALGQDEKEFPPIDDSLVDLNNLFTRDMWRYNFSSVIGGEKSRNVRKSFATLIRKLGAEGHVLLKNENRTLPLKKPQKVGIVGSAAGDFLNGEFGLEDSEIGMLPIGGGAGGGRFTDPISPLQAIRDRVRLDGGFTQFVLNNTEVVGAGKPDFYPVPDVCLVFLKTYATEGRDRTSLDPDDNGNEVVENTANFCPSTIVVVYGGQINYKFAQNPNVTAIIAAHYPGEELGNALVDILYGMENPSGHLPYSVPKNSKDYNILPANFTGTTQANAWQANFTEGILVDYKYFDSHDIEPLYEFGYGLSYTTFNASNIKASELVGSIREKPAAERGFVSPGGNANLWEDLVEVSFEISNTGVIAGGVASQLYVSLPQENVPSGTPIRMLRGFEKVFLNPSQNQEVKLRLQRRDVSFWDVIEQEWKIPTGDIKFFVGFSSRDIKLSTSKALR